MIQKFRSLEWADYLIFSLFDSRKLYYLVRDAKQDFLSFTIVFPVLAAAIHIICVSSLYDQSTYFVYKMTYGWIALSIIFIFLSYLISALIDHAIQFMGRQGEAKKIFTFCNFSFLPQVLLLPVFNLFKVMNFAPFFIYILLLLLSFCHGMIIIVQNISEMHSISVSRAFASYAIPFVVIGLVMFSLMVLSIAMIIGFFVTL